jgi:hypothetical protein
MIRRKVKKKEAIQRGPRRQQVVAAPPQWIYIKNCTHNLTDKSCPLCKLIERETAQWLANEHAEKEQIRKENFYKRAEMRYCLLREWSKNQISLYSDVVPLPTAEIILCSSIFETLTSCSQDLGEIFQDLNENLLKRNRIMEVGNYAATFLQCRIRGFCCRKRITTFLLRRFEYHEESARRGAYFLDKNTGNRFYSTPYLISHEKPGSPRTIQRRITFQNKIREKRMEKYQQVCRSDTQRHEGGGGGQWASTEKRIVLGRQLVILRDLLFALLKELSQKRRELGERPTVPVPALSLTSSNNSDPKPSSVDSSPESFAYWFTLSNPAPPARQLYLSLAMETDPLEKEEEIVASGLELQAVAEESNSQPDRKSSLARPQPKRVSINPMATVSSEPTSDVKAEVSVIPIFNLNERLQQLDQRIWAMMRSHTADEMVAKLIDCEELEPTLSSCQQIAEDEHLIWRQKFEAKVEEVAGEEKIVTEETKTSAEDIRDLAVMGQYRRPLPSSSLGSRSESKQFSSQGSEEEEEKKRPHSTGAPPIDRSLTHGTYLPCQLQLHPFYPNRSPSGVVRLFFIDGVISAVSHSSPWVYYPEVARPFLAPLSDPPQVWKNKTALVRAICEFADSKPVRSLLRAFMSRANDIPSPLSAPAGTIPPLTNPPPGRIVPRSLPLPPTTPKPVETTSPPPPAPSNVISVVLPDQQTIFGSYPALTTCTLTGSEYRSVDQKYRCAPLFHSPLLVAMLLTLA